MTLRSGLVGALTVVLALASPAQVSKQGSRYLLRMKLEGGKTYSYSIVHRIVFPDRKRPVDMSGQFTLKVQSVRDGVASVVTQYKGLQGTSDQAVSGKVDSKGDVVAGQSPELEMVKFPDKAVKIGDSWKNTSTTESLFGRVKVSSTLTLRKIGSVGGKRVAVISVAMTITGAKVSGSGTGSIQVATADGVLQSVDAENRLVVTSTNSKGAPVKQTLPVRTIVKRI